MYFSFLFECVWNASKISRQRDASEDVLVCVVDSCARAYCLPLGECVVRAEHVLFVREAMMASFFLLIIVWHVWHIASQDTVLC